MRLSDANREKYKKCFNDLNENVRNRIRTATVLLQQQPPGGFICSGVVVAANLQTNVAIVFTAKHNLWFIGDKKEGPDTLYQKFSTVMQIHFNVANVGEPTNQQATFANNQPVDHFLSNESDVWMSDLMMLTATNNDLTNCALFKSPLEVKSNYNDGGIGIENPKTVLTRKDGKVIQAGFGYSDDSSSVGDKNVKKFQVRFTEPEAIEVADRVEDRDNGKVIFYSDVVILNANRDTSTASGDSGGPLFMVSGAGGKDPKLYFLGCTLGSDMVMPTQKTPADKFFNNAASYAAKFYHQVFKKIIDGNQ